METQISLEFARQILQSQGFSKFLGTEITRFDSIVELRLAMKAEFTQHNGFAHGGVISYMADLALTFAGGLELGSNVLTSEYKINYLKPGLGDTLIARAEVIGSGKRQAVCRCDVFMLKDGQETLCATSQGTIVTFGG